MKFYCENCGEEELSEYIELYDGTIVCSEKCKKEWEVSCKEEIRNESLWEDYSHELKYGITNLSYEEWLEERR